MLVFSQRFFEDFLYDQTPVSTAFQHSRLLSLADQLAIQVVTWKVTATGAATLTLSIEHSTDGRVWLARNITAPAISAAPISTTAQTVLFGYDAGRTGRLAYTRFTINLHTTGTQVISGYVRVIVSGRDKTKTRPCFCDDDYKLTYYRPAPR